MLACGAARPALTATVLVGVGGLSVLSAAPAYAHGVHATEVTIGSMLAAGFLHMLLGWDHILFVLGIALISQSLRQAAGLLTVFALGHSATLLFGALAGWQVNPWAVDAVIGLSLAFLATAGLWGGLPTPVLAGGVFAFGLVHGLGLATRLQELHLPDDGVLGPVLAFNVGVELGQLVAVLAAFALWEVGLKCLDGPVFRQLAYGFLGLAGILVPVAMVVSSA